MDFSDPAQRAAFFTVHSQLPREGPGDSATVRRALDLARPLPANPAVLDIACGPGGQTLDLAELLPDAHFTALDSHPPFLDELEQRIAGQEVRHRIHPMRGDMGNLPFQPESFDLIWCEGAAYILGLETALTRWKPLLRPGGILALTEPVWLKNEVPEPVKACWAEYPAMGTPDDTRALARRCGYTIKGDFILDEAAWWTYYYTPIEARLPQLEHRYPHDPTIAMAIRETREEIDCYRHHADCYGYLFIVLQR